MNAALTLTSLLQVMTPAPELVLQVGIAGALPVKAGPGASPGARPGDLVIATQEAYSNLGSSSPGGWLSASELGLPVAMVDEAESGACSRSTVAWWSGPPGRSGLRRSPGPPSRPPLAGPAEPPAVLVGPCVTSSAMTGRDEEAKVIAERSGRPGRVDGGGRSGPRVCPLSDSFLELRGISNMAGERDRSTWVVDEAVRIAGRAALVLAAALARKAGG